MRRSWVDDTGREAFREAIEAIEGSSAIEVVVKVRHHSGTYVHADLLGGIAAAWAALAFMLFSPSVAFSVTALLVDPLLVGVIAGFVTHQVPALRRWTTPAGMRRTQVEQAAKAAFFSGGIRMTRDRTGVLVYVSLLERTVELVADRTVSDTLGKQLVEDRKSLQGVLTRDFKAVSLARALARLADPWGRALPRREDDINELSDEVLI